jgi:thiamine kinase-like enzyme
MALRDVSFPFEAVAEAVGSAPLSWESVATRGYGLANAHWRVTLAAGRSAFVKQALTPDGVSWLKRERAIYEAVRQPFMPSFLGAFDDEELVLIALEDLTDAEWVPPWSGERIESVLATLDQLHRPAPLEGLKNLGDERAELAGWLNVAANPEPLLSTGLCTASWLEEALPKLLQATVEAPLAGSELLHMDVRSDNLCFRGNQALLFDWNLACVGNGDFDIAFWLPSLALEGGPSPWEVLPDAGPLSAVVAGFFASRAGLPIPPTAPTVREFQRVQAEVALGWAASELGLPPPPADPAR